MQRRIHIRQAATIDDHAEILRQETAEVAALFRDLLIAVTKFFRDAGGLRKPGQRRHPRVVQEPPGWW